MTSGRCPTRTESLNPAGQHRINSSHQANKTMVVDLATGAGLSPDQLYFNIERMGTPRASIPLATTTRSATE
jgi:hypothetical protein